MSRLDIQTVLGRAVANGASDVHVVAGIPVKYRIAGELRSLDDDVMSPDDTAALCFAMLSEEQRAAILSLTAAVLSVITRQLVTPKEK